MPILGMALVAAGILGLFLHIQKTTPIVFDYVNDTPVNAAQTSLGEVEYVSGKPVNISIPSIGMNLEVKPGYYNAASQSWTLSETAAHYATITKPANNKEGNTFIYGHNLPKVFEPLSGLKAGDIAYIGTDNGKTFKYRLNRVTVASPNDTAVLRYSGSPVLTIQTCSGAWYEKRSLFWFEYVEVT